MAHQHAAERDLVGEAHMNTPRGHLGGNQGPSESPGPHSPFMGVIWDEESQSWKAQMMTDGTMKCMGLFDTEEAAARKYDKGAAHFGLPLNFAPSNQLPVGIPLDGFGSVDDDHLTRTAQDLDDTTTASLSRPKTNPGEGPHQAMEEGRGGMSKFKGVCWSEGSQKWHSQIYIDGKKKNLGYFDSEEAAARKYDGTAASHGRALNFDTLTRLPAGVPPDGIVDAHIPKPRGDVVQLKKKRNRDTQAASSDGQQGDENGACSGQSKLVRNKQQAGVCAETPCIGTAQAHDETAAALCRPQERQFEGNEQAKKGSIGVQPKFKGAYLNSRS